MPVSRQQNDRRKKLCKVCLKAVPRGETVIRAPADSCAERNTGAEELEELARDL